MDKKAIFFKGGKQSREVGKNSIVRLEAFHF